MVVNSERQKRSPEELAAFVEIKSFLQNKDEEQAKSRISNLNNFNYRDNDGKTILHYACKYECEDVVQFLVESYYSSVDFDVLDNEGNTSLMIAASKSHNKIAIMLAENGNVDVSKQLLKDKQGKHIYGNKTALSIAVENKNLEVIKAIINTKKVDLKLELSKKSRTTVLHLIARDKTPKNIEIAKILLTKEAITTLRLRSINGVTPLRTAVKNDNLEIVKLFVERFPDLIRKEKILQIKGNHNDRGTPLHDAIKHKNVEIFKLLLTVATKEDLAIENRKGEIPINLIDKIKDVTIHGQMRAAYSDFMLRDNIEIMDVDNQQPEVEGDANVQLQGEKLREAIFGALDERNVGIFKNLVSMATAGDLSAENADGKTLTDLISKIEDESIHNQINEILIKRTWQLVELSLGQSNPQE